MYRTDGTTFPCKLFGLCDRDYYRYRGYCETCQTIDIFVELNKLERGQGIRAVRTKLEHFPCALGGRRRCTPFKGYEHLCETCKVRDAYLEYIEAWAKEDTSWLHQEEQ